MGLLQTRNPLLPDMPGPFPDDTAISQGAAAPLKPRGAGTPQAAQMPAHGMQPVAPYPEQSRQPLNALRGPVTTRLRRATPQLGDFSRLDEEFEPLAPHLPQARAAGDMSRRWDEHIAGLRRRDEEYRAGRPAESFAERVADRVRTDRARPAAPGVSAGREPREQTVGTPSLEDQIRNFFGGGMTDHWASGMGDIRPMSERHAGLFNAPATGYIQPGTGPGRTEQLPPQRSRASAPQYESNSGRSVYMDIPPPPMPPAGLARWYTGEQVAPLHTGSDVPNVRGFSPAPPIQGMGPQRPAPLPGPRPGAERRSAAGLRGVQPPAGYTGIDRPSVEGMLGGRAAYNSIESRIAERTGIPRREISPEDVLREYRSMDSGMGQRDPRGAIEPPSAPPPSAPSKSRNSRRR